jgi:hypothetical protein
VSQIFILDLRGSHQFDMPTSLPRSLKKPEWVIDFCAVPEFDAYVRFIGEDPTKLNA